MPVALIVLQKNNCGIGALVVSERKWEGLMFRIVGAGCLRDSQFGVQ